MRARTIAADAYRADGHPCRPPRSADRTVPCRVGATWECPECGRVWIVRERETTHGGHLLIGPYRRVWRPAGPLSRFRRTFGVAGRPSP